MKEQRDVGQLSPAENGKCTQMYTNHKKNISNRNMKPFKGESSISTCIKDASPPPELDSVGLTRCISRLKYAEFLPYDARFPVILP